MKWQVIYELEREELAELLRFLPKQLVVSPFKDKQYRQFAAGFRLENLPFDKILNFYSQQILKKKDPGLAEFLYDLAEGNLEPIEQDLLKCLNRILEDSDDNSDKTETAASSTETDELETGKPERPTGLNLTRVELELLKDIVKEVCSDRPIKEFILCLRLQSAKLSEDQWRFLEVKRETENKLTEANKLIKREMELHFGEEMEERLARNDEQWKHKLAKMKTKHERELAVAREETVRLNQAIQKKVEILQAEKARLQTELKQSRNELQMFSIEVDELTRANNELKKQLGSLTERYEKQSLEAEKEIDGLRREIKKMAGITLAALVKPRDINEALQAVEKESIKLEFRKYFAGFEEMSVKEDVDLVNLWKGWLVKEEKQVVRFLEGLIFDGCLDKRTLQELEDTAYLLQLRYLLVKVVSSLGYRMIASQEWGEVFGE